MRDSSKDFLGRGWAYPVSVEKATGSVAMSEYEGDIQEAIKIILSTRQGERVMRPDFGSRLHEYVFESDSLGIRSQIEHEAIRCLEIWEPRISDIEISAAYENSGGFYLDISYVVRSTNNPFNLVYPFFITEGTI